MNLRKYAVAGLIGLFSGCIPYVSNTPANIGKNPQLDITLRLDSSAVTQILITYDLEKAKRDGKCKDIYGMISEGPEIEYKVKYTGCLLDADNKPDYKTITNTTFRNKDPYLEGLVLVNEKGEFLSESCILRSWTIGPDGRRVSVKSLKLMPCTELDAMFKLH